MRAQEWTLETLKLQTDDFETASPRDILNWSLDTFGVGLVMATGFGLSGIVLAHHLARLSPETAIFYLETDLLFPETYTLRDRLAARLGLSFLPVHSGISLERQHQEQGPNLWAHSPDQCCFIRKVLPLRRFLADKTAWVTGLRRDQSPARAHTRIVEWDGAHGLVKINPLAFWTKKEVWRYIHQHDLPYNPLLDDGYTSIGCMPCTRPIAPGEDARAGRWSGFAKTECGIHAQPRAA